MLRRLKSNWPAGGEIVYTTYFFVRGRGQHGVQTERVEVVSRVASTQCQSRKRGQSIVLCPS